MCAIISSFDPKEIKKLVELNAYRGNFSWSITGITKDYRILIQEKGFGEFPIDRFDILSEASIEKLYWVCHVQAPTGGQLNEIDRIHPVEDSPHKITRLLWHNGVIKREWIHKAQDRLCEETSFDTALILYGLVTNDIESPFLPERTIGNALEDIDGSFACLYLKEGHFLKVFRNTASPLFVNGTTLSSAIFPDSGKLDSEVIFDIDLDVEEIQPEAEFKNCNKPFYFGGK